MEEQDYHERIAANDPAGEASEKICSVNKWWTANFEGSTRNLGDAFTLRRGRNTFSKLTWLVTDSHMPWLKHKSEWTDTKISFEFSEYADPAHRRPARTRTSQPATARAPSA